MTAFRELSEGTGGTLTESPSDPYGAVTAAHGALEMTSGFVGGARAYMAAAEAVGSYDPEDVAPAMGMPKEAASGLLGYLKRRGIV